MGSGDYDGRIHTAEENGGSRTANGPSAGSIPNDSLVGNRVRGLPRANFATGRDLRRNGNRPGAFERGAFGRLGYTRQNYGPAGGMRSRTGTTKNPGRMIVVAEFSRLAKGRKLTKETGRAVETPKSTLRRDMLSSEKASRKHKSSVGSIRK